MHFANPLLLRITEWKMKIQKIKEKLDFEVEAQDTCKHGSWRINVFCSYDCAEGQVWVSQSQKHVNLDGIEGEFFREFCTQKTVYGCATMHLL